MLWIKSKKLKPENGGCQKAKKLETTDHCPVTNILTFHLNVYIHMPVKLDLYPAQL